MALRSSPTPGGWSTRARGWCSTASTARSATSTAGSPRNSRGCIPTVKLPSSQSFSCQYGTSHPEATDGRIRTDLLRQGSSWRHHCLGSRRTLLGPDSRPGRFAHGERQPADHREPSGSIGREAGGATDCHGCQIDGGENGMSLWTVLFVVFLVLKLVGVIAWSWWLVFLPLIIWVGIIVWYVYLVHKRRQQALARLLARERAMSHLRRFR